MDTLRLLLDRNAPEGTVKSSDDVNLAIQVGSSSIRPSHPQRLNLYRLTVNDAKGGCLLYSLTVRYSYVSDLDSDFPDRIRIFWRSEIRKKVQTGSRQKDSDPKHCTFKCRLSFPSSKNTATIIIAFWKLPILPQ